MAPKLKSQPPLFLLCDLHMQINLVPQASGPSAGQALPQRPRSWRLKRRRSPPGHSHSGRDGGPDSCLPKHQHIRSLDGDSVAQCKKLVPVAGNTGLTDGPRRRASPEGLHVSLQEEETRGMEAAERPAGHPAAGRGSPVRPHSSRRPSRGPTFARGETRPATEFHPLTLRSRALQAAGPVQLRQVLGRLWGPSQARVPAQEAPCSLLGPTGGWRRTTPGCTPAEGL